MGLYETELLEILASRPNSTLVDLRIALGIFAAEFASEKIGRALQRLKRAGLADVTRRRWTLTNLGRERMGLRAEPHTKGQHG